MTAQLLSAILKEQRKHVNVPTDLYVLRELHSELDYWTAMDRQNILLINNHRQ